MGAHKVLFMYVLTMRRVAEKFYSSYFVRTLNMQLMCLFSPFISISAFANCYILHRIFKCVLVVEKGRESSYVFVAEDGRGDGSMGC